MANKIKGEVAFKADGQDYRLVLDFNALCEAEQHIPDILDKGMEAMKSLSGIRSAFWAGLQRFHRGLTMEGAGDLIQAIGADKAGALIGESFEAAWGKGGEGASDPQ